MKKELISCFYDSSNPDDFDTFYFKKSKDELDMEKIESTIDKFNEFFGFQNRK